MPEEFHKMSKDEVLLNKVEQDIISGNEVPDHIVKYLEEKYPSFLPLSLEDKPIKKKKIKVNTKKVAATVMVAGALAMGIAGLYNSSAAVRDRAIADAHNDFNNLIVPQIIAENNINQEDLVGSFFELRDITASELGIDNNCATYALLDYYETIGLDGELYQRLGYEDKTDYATSLGYKLGEETDQIIYPASTRFDNMEEGEFLEAVTNYENLNNNEITYEGESNAR